MWNVVLWWQASRQEVHWIVKTKKLQYIKEEYGKKSEPSERERKITNLLNCFLSSVSSCHLLLSLPLSLSLSLSLSLFLCVSFFVFLSHSLHKICINIMYTTPYVLHVLSAVSIIISQQFVLVCDNQKSMWETLSLPFSITSLVHTLYSLIMNFSRVIVIVICCTRIIINKYIKKLSDKCQKDTKRIDIIK